MDVDGESLVDGEDADHIDHLYEGHLKGLTTNFWD